MANDNTMLWVIGGGIVAYWLYLQSQDQGPGATAAAAAGSSSSSSAIAYAPAQTLAPSQTSGIVSTTPAPVVTPKPILTPLVMCPGGGSPPCGGPIMGNGGQPVNIENRIASSPYFGGGPTYAPGSVDCAFPNYMSNGICYPPLVRDPRPISDPITITNTPALLGLGRLGRAPIRWSQPNGIPIIRRRG